MLHTHFFITFAYFVYLDAVVSRHVYGGACSVIVFRDVNTPQPFVEDLSQYGDDGRSQRVTSPDHVYVDAMGFGMGCSCLQVTFQACNINEARHLYDQLTPLTPVLVSRVTRVHHRFFFCRVSSMIVLMCTLFAHFMYTCTQSMALIQMNRFESASVDSTCNYADTST